MHDSWRPLKLEPGFAAQYSMPSVLSTSTMKSDPGFSLPVTSTAPRASPVALCSTGCAPAIGAAAKPAAPAAAPFRKPRRPTGLFAFDMVGLVSSLPTEGKRD